MNKFSKFAVLALLIAGLGTNNQAQAKVDAQSVACYAVAGAAVGGLAAIYAKEFGRWLYKNPETIFMTLLGFSTELIPAEHECLHGIAASAAALTCCAALVRKKSYFAAAATTLLPYYIGSELATNIS